MFQGIGAQAKERVSLGDVNNDGTTFGLRVRGADGETILLDENGVKREGITDGAITNEKISGEANIDGSKLNINSVVNRINEDGTEVISGVKIDVDGTNLNTKLSNITIAQTEQSEKIEQAQTDILVNERAIKLKVDNQIYEQDKTTNEVKFNKLTSDISVLEDKISLKVEGTDVSNAINDMQIGVRNYVKDCRFRKENIWSKSREEAKIDSMEGYGYLTSSTVNPFLYQRFKENEFKIGDTITIQYEMKCSNVSANTGNDSFLIRVQLTGYDSNNSHVRDIGIFGKHENECSKFKNWTKVTKTLKLTGENNFTSTSLRLYARNFKGNIYFRNVKLEKGNKATDLSTAQEDVDVGFDEVYDHVSDVQQSVINSYESALEVTKKNITLSVNEKYAKKDDVSSAEQRLSSKIDQTAKDISFTFNKSTDEVKNDLQDFRDEITSYIRFDANGMELGKQGSKFKTRLSNEKLAFLQGEDEVAYISNNKMNITDAEVKNQLTLGSYAFVPRTNGNLSLKWIR